MTLEDGLRGGGGGGWIAALVVGLCGCGPSAPPPEQIVTDEAVDAPLRRADAVERARFAEGDRLFEVAFRPSDGLGPLYIRGSCASCHLGGTNGPGVVQKVAVVREDGSPSEDPSRLPYGHTVRPYVTAGAKTPISAPAPAADLRLSERVGPSILGRGYLEAIDEAEIERVAAAQAAAGGAVSGRVNYVAFASERNPEQPYHGYQKGQERLIGRFGLKSRIPSLDDFTADAFQGDMGITSPMRPTEPSNPDGLVDDSRPGLDVTLGTVNAVADYVRLVEIPDRPAPEAVGVALFAQVGCADCHVPSLRTRPDYPIAALAGIEAPVFSDLLLHDMGSALADGLVDGSAGPREWRTAPLIGLRFLRSYLHDGRARSVADAIELHDGDGSEAGESVRAFRGLGAVERQALLSYVESL